MTAPVAEQPRLPDTMGVWDDGGIAWVARAHYPTRGAARAFYAGEVGCDFIEVSARARHMRFAPKSDLNWEDLDEFWVECARDAPGAFPVWRLE